MDFLFSSVQLHYAINLSYYYLANQGIESATLQRIRHDQPITTATLGKLCKIMHCAPEDLICYQESEED